MRALLGLVFRAGGACPARTVKVKFSRARSSAASLAANFRVVEWDYPNKFGSRSKSRSNSGFTVPTLSSPTDGAASSSDDSQFAPITSPIEDDFKFEKEIGAGAFARVWLASSKTSGAQVAVKVMPKSVNPNGMQEVEMLRRVSHQFVMPLLACYETEDKVMLVTPYYSGCDVYDYIERTYETDESQIPEQDALVLAAQMLAAAEALHHAGVVHLDIKPENYMFATHQSGSDLVLVDFGSAEPMKLVSYADTMEQYDPRLDDQLPLERLDRVTGTANYLSPEVADGRFSSRSDVFSVGVCLFTLLTGLSPFSNEDLNSRKAHIRSVAQKADFTCDEWARVSQDSIDVCKWMLRPDPQLRCSTTEALVAIKTCLEIQKANELRSKAFGRFERTRAQSKAFRQTLLETDDVAASPYNNPERAASRMLADLELEPNEQSDADDVWTQWAERNGRASAAPKAPSVTETPEESSCNLRREKMLGLISDLDDGELSK